jgi:hypothetical protein
VGRDPDRPPVGRHRPVPIRVGGQAIGRRGTMSASDGHRPTPCTQDVAVSVHPVRCWPCADGGVTRPVASGPRRQG